MKNLNVGSTNTVKIEAVREAVSRYNLFSPAIIKGIEVESGVSKQPKSLDEIIRGAVNRARNAFVNCDYSFGLESGQIEVPYTKTGYMYICACTIYDGKEFNFGLSPGFECPPEVTRLVLEEGLDLNEAFYKVGLTTNPNLGAGEGVISILTNGRVNRKDYTQYAVIMALIKVVG
ncbi:MAG TPA: inosine/xanthosine triphosphatase [Candidatus Nanoarchaeia archaeon]|nr:inosine/xanthosine triphosphatase [Candidatus Nanoarchaeia archaeon]